MKTALITLAAIVGVGLIALCMLMSSRNGAINLEEQVNTSKSGIDVQLSNRFNKLHELAACVNVHGGIQGGLDDQPCRDDILDSVVGIHGWHSIDFLHH